MRSIPKGWTGSHRSASPRRYCCASADLDPDAAALARAVAVLGEQARLSLCAQLAGLDTRKARELACGLVDLAVLVPGEPLALRPPDRADRDL